MYVWQHHYIYINQSLFTSLVQQLFFISNYLSSIALYFTCISTIYLLKNALSKYSFFKDIVEVSILYTIFRIKTHVLGSIWSILWVTKFYLIWNISDCLPIFTVNKLARPVGPVLRFFLRKALFVLHFSSLSLCNSVACYLEVVK